MDYLKTDGNLDGVVPLMTDPPPTNSTIMLSRLVYQDINLCLGGTAYMPGPARPLYLWNQLCYFKNIQGLECPLFLMVSSDSVY